MPDQLILLAGLAVAGAVVLPPLLWSRPAIPAGDEAGYTCIRVDFQEPVPGVNALGLDAYALLPGASPGTVRDYAASPPVTVLSNTPGLQAVRRGDTVGASFWSTEEQSVAGITARTRVSVLVVRDGSRLSVAISDPSQTVQGRARVGLDHRIGQVVTADPRIQLQASDATSTLLVDLSDARGQSFAAVFETA